MTAEDPTVHEYSCDSADPERHWVPGWYPLARAASALTFKSERVVLRWARRALQRCPDARLRPAR
jgi:hypothetical protein